MNEENKTPMTEDNASAVVPEVPTADSVVQEDIPASQNTVESAETTEEKAQDARQSAIDEMEAASKKALDAMREQGNARNDEVVDEAEDKVKDMFDQFKEWMNENTNPDRIKAELEKVTNETAQLLNTTKEKVIDVAQSDQFRSTMKSGKDFLTGTGGMISDGFKYGYDKLMEIPEFKKVSNKIDEGVDKVRHNEDLKNFVDYAEKGLNDLNGHIFAGLKSFFEPAKETSQQKKEVLPDLPEQDHASTEE